MFSRAVGLILPSWVKWAALAALMAAAAVSGAWWTHVFEQARYDALHTKHSTFVAATESGGRAALKEAKTKAANDKKLKEISDADLKAARNAAADANRGWLQLAQSRAVGGYLPAPAASSPSPDRATLDRAEFERTMGSLDERGARIAAQGDAARVDLDVAKRWAAGQGPP